MNRYITEFIGTFFLVLTIGLSGNPLAIGFILAALVYMGGHVSGAHYNPAVSLGLYFRRLISQRDMLIYMLCQILGAILASLFVWYLLGNTFGPAPGANVSIIKAIFVEFLFTFALVLVVLNVATTKKTEGNSYFGMAIGLIILAGAIAGGPISGGGFNPAVALGSQLVDLLNGGNLISNIYIYLIGPFLASVTAPFVYAMMNPIEQKEADLKYHESQNISNK